MTVISLLTCDKKTRKSNKKLAQGQKIINKKMSTKDFEEPEPEFDELEASFDLNDADFGEEFEIDPATEKLIDIRVKWLEFAL